MKKLIIVLMILIVLSSVSVMGLDYQDAYSCQKIYSSTVGADGTSYSSGQSDPYSYGIVYYDNDGFAEVSGEYVKDSCRNSDTEVREYICDNTANSNKITYEDVDCPGGCVESNGVGKCNPDPEGPSKTIDFDPSLITPDMADAEVGGLDPSVADLGSKIDLTDVSISGLDPSVTDMANSFQCDDGYDNDGDGEIDLGGCDYNGNGILDEDAYPASADKGSEIINERTMTELECTGKKSTGVFSFLKGGAIGNFFLSITGNNIVAPVPTAVADEDDNSGMIMKNTPVVESGMPTRTVTDASAFDFNSVLEGTCVDSDDGQDYYTYGEVSFVGETGQHTDVCCKDDTLALDTYVGPCDLPGNDLRGTEYLVERYCDDTGELAYDLVDCPFGCDVDAKACEPMSNEDLTLQLRDDLEFSSGPVWYEADSDCTSELDDSESSAEQTCEQVVMYVGDEITVGTFGLKHVTLDEVGSGAIVVTISDVVKTMLTNPTSKIINVGNTETVNELEITVYDATSYSVREDSYAYLGFGYCDGVEWGGSTVTDDYCSDGYDNDGDGFADTYGVCVKADGTALTGYCAGANNIEQFMICSDKCTTEGGTYYYPDGGCKNDEGREKNRCGDGYDNDRDGYVDIWGGCDYDTSTNPADGKMDAVCGCDMDADGYLDVEEIVAESDCDSTYEYGCLLIANGPEYYNGQLLMGMSKLDWISGSGTSGTCNGNFYLPDPECSSISDDNERDGMNAIVLPEIIIPL
jgi:hypothetical protein